MAKKTRFAAKSARQAREARYAAIIHDHNSEKFKAQRATELMERGLRDMPK